MEDEIRQYFQSISPIARRVWVDVESCKESYEDAWNYLSSEEQNQVINENIIHPEAVLKYSVLENVAKSGVVKQSQRRRIIEDELGAKWEDEHATPFSWFTQSQLSLAEAGNPKLVDPVLHDRSAERELPTTRISKPAPKVAAVLLPVFSQPETSEVKEESLAESKIYPAELDSDDVNITVEEPDHNIATNGTMDVADEAAAEDHAPDIPRTGFEFLDNW